MLTELRGLRSLVGGLEVLVLRREDARPEESLEDTELEETEEDARLEVLKLEGPRPLLHHRRKALRSGARKVLSWPRNMAHTSSRVPRVPQVRNP